MNGSGGAFRPIMRLLGMHDNLTNIKATLSQASSFRRMYMLSAAIAESDPVAPEVRSAAKRVVKTLGTVIDLPVADAKVLTKARKQFVKLCKLLM